MQGVCILTLPVAKWCCSGALRSGGAVGHPWTISSASLCHRFGRTLFSSSASCDSHLAGYGLSASASMLHSKPVRPWDIVLSCGSLKSCGDWATSQPAHWLLDCPSPPSFSLLSQAELTISLRFRVILPYTAVASTFGCLFSFFIHTGVVVPSLTALLRSFLDCSPWSGSTLFALKIHSLLERMFVRPRTLHGAWGRESSWCGHQ